MLYNGDLLNIQIVNSIIYLQNTIVFILTLNFLTNVRLDYVIKLFICVIFLSSLRVLIEEPNQFFQLSIRWTERIEALFIGGVNNFALFNGLAFCFSFFYLKKGWIKVFLCLVFLVVIVLTMSRGALLGVILAVFITAFYDTNRRTLRLLIKFASGLFFIGLSFLYFTGKLDSVIEIVKNRFFSLFTGEQELNVFFSGRGSLFINIFERMKEAPLFQFLFGHGNGGISFFDPESNQDYETSHNILIDILYRNGIFILGIYILVFIYIFLLFIKHRHKQRLALFSTFVFFHLELLVNPVLFAAQVGWIYSIFLGLFLMQNKLLVDEG
ncbi:O-antigen ligase family protein [Urechidicola vernalis]|uniref:O-antigen ligase family protein n=1 Tax=Urechidicola vernalis TaxID=3075600 RepID=A0ABU2Y921_9FLAO|nr:O-antigen ligase family protein [Urechidicola sp. P050]MDT0554159.1 O-antigen ligase family protein [Urechidicola sp. P050]